MSQGDCVSIQINGQALQVERGLTILEAARQNGIAIPTLCDFPGLPSRGSCRLCVVEIAGRQNTPTACTTPVEAGMAIATHSPKVMALRKELIQMLLAEHPAACLFCPEKDHCDECMAPHGGMVPHSGKVPHSGMVTLRKAGVTTGCGACPKDGQCELQALAEEYEVRQPGYPIRYRMVAVENRDPFFDHDPNLCVLCGRCIRVCEHTHFANTLAHNGRGAQTLVSTAFQRSHLESDCAFCGRCVEVCPTGAITEKTRKWEGKPERLTASTCPFCSIGCQIDLLSKQERVIGSLPNHAAGTDVLCVNGRFGVPELVDPATRLKQPQLPAAGAWQPATWEEALHLAAEKLRACPPERFEMRISAACTNEDLFVARQFARVVMKSDPLLAAARQRYGGALGSLARLLRASAPLEQLLEPSDAAPPAILCVGLDDPYAQSVVAVRLHRARSRGAKLIHLSLCPAGQARSHELGWSDVHLAAEDGLEPAAHLLARSNRPVILVSAAALADPHNTHLLPALEALVARLNAKVAVLPEENNLAGALRLGLAEAPSAAQAGPDVQYLIGEPLPEPQSGAAFIIAHALALPEGGAFDGLLLPAAAFSEVEGTMIDYAGRLQAFHPAVPPAGESLPAWKILARIAAEMGAPGFDYHCVEDIWQAAQAEFAGFPARHAWPAMAFDEGQAPGAGWREPEYLGQPLARRVAGLRSLYPEPGLAEER